MQNAIEKSFNFQITTFEQAHTMAKMIASSSLAPRDFKDNPGNVLVAMQMGAEIGLKPMQAIQNIAVINGRPCIWGDAALAVVKSHSSFEEIKEYMEGKIEDGTAIAYCIVKRKNEEAVTRSFSVTQAKTASLWGKQGPWTQYKERMLQMRARSFALRDSFPDALKGFRVAEEERDITPERDVTPKKSFVKSESPALEILKKTISENVEEKVEDQEYSRSIAEDYFDESSEVNELNKYKQIISNSISIAELKSAFAAAWSNFKGDDEGRKELKKVYDEKTETLTNQ